MSEAAPGQQPSSAAAEPRPHRTLIEHASWAVFWNAAFFPLKAVVGLLASVVVVRLLRTEGYATYKVTMALLTTLGLFADFGIERTLPRFYPEVEMRTGRKGVLRLLGWVAFVKALVLAVLVLALLLAPNFVLSATGTTLGPDQQVLVWMICALLVLGAASDVSVQLLYTHFKQKTTNSLDILAAVVSPSLSALFVLLGWGVPGVIFALLVTTVLSVVISIWLSLRLIGSLPADAPEARSAVNLPSQRTLRDRLVSYAALNYLINWSVYLYDRPFVILAIGLLVIAPDDKKVEVAIISLAYDFTRQFLRVLVVPITGVQTSLFARLFAQGRIDGLKTAYATLTKFMILALLPAGVGLILTSRNLLQVLYGQISRDAVLTRLTIHEAIACTLILTVGLFGEALISIALNVLMVYEEYRAVIVARLAALVSIPLLILLVPTYGAVGAAIAVAAAGLGSRALALVYALRRIGLPFPSGFFVRVGTAAAVMGSLLLPTLLLPVTYLSTLIMVLGGAVAFLIVFKLLGGIEAADKERFRSLRLPLVAFVLRFL